MAEANNDANVLHYGGLDDDLTPEEAALFAGNDHDGWDQETGKPTATHFSNAVQVWSAMQEGDVSVRRAATAFNCDPLMIIGAVKHHYWMFLEGPLDDFDKLTIGHEGE